MTDALLPECFSHLPIAHRGLHDRCDGRVENSRAAFRAAVEHGYGIELDIQMSSDGEAMVFHDEGLKRLTGQKGLVRDKTAEALVQIELSGAGGETIPTLTEVLTLVAGRVPLLIEIKDQDGAFGPDVGPLEQRVAALLAGYDGPVALMSFNPHSVAASRDAAPGIPRGLITCAYHPSDCPGVPAERLREMAKLKDIAHLGVSFVSHDVNDLENAALAGLKQAGLPVFCWTIRSARVEAAARKIADNITFEGYLAAIPTT